MNGICTCGALEAVRCQCAVASTDCIELLGRGVPSDPFLASPKLHPSSVNTLECSPGGFGAFLPRHLANPPGAFIQMTVSQPLDPFTFQGIIFNRVRFDTDTMVDTTTPEITRLTINTTGIYLITAWVLWQRNNLGERRLNIRINGTAIIHRDERRAVAAGSQTAHHCATMFNLEVGDYIELLANHTAISDDPEDVLLIEQAYMGTMRVGRK